MWKLFVSSSDFYSIMVSEQ
jgi:hypothetical protein